MSPIVIRQPRLHSVAYSLALVLATLLLAYALLSMYDIGVAHASAAGFPDPLALQASTVDPVAVAQSSTDAGWSLIATYGPLWGGALLAFGLAGAFLKRNAADHWLAQGRTLALATGAVSMLGALLAWKFQGADLSGVVVTLIMAIKLALSPGVTPVAAKA